MKDPWEVLGLSPAADDAVVRQRYLELVRQHPPERDPERFAEIHGAYEELRNPMRRLERQLFWPEEDATWEHAAAGVLATLTAARRIPTSVLLSLGDEP
jgi:curved DNA-binding protein CbpA